MGVAPEDIQTQNYSLYPEYDYNNGITSSTPTGYSANQQIIVKVKDVDKQPDKVSRVIAEASKAGANQVLGVSFDVSNLEDLKQQARLKAIADAQDKAGKLATAAKVRLGDVIGWWDNVVQVPGLQTQYYDKGGVGGAGMGNGTIAVLPNGSQEVIMEVNLNYQVK
jgi:uncharacterized protein YggE